MWVGNYRKIRQAKEEELKKDLRAWEKKRVKKKKRDMKDQERLIQQLLAMRQSGKPLTGDQKKELAAYDEFISHLESDF